MNTAHRIVSGMKWANALKSAKPYWLMRLYPDVIRLLDKDGVTAAWVRGAQGPQEFIEVTWTAPHVKEMTEWVKMPKRECQDELEEREVGRAKEDA